MVTPDINDVQGAVGARYEVLDVIGTGGMGAVFRARHRELGHLVAIKVLPPEIAASRGTRSRRCWSGENGCRWLTCCGS